jgi:radical SAM superfamily enzyme YgiQ (UPF0313 family)
MWTTTYRMRDPARVVDEMEENAEAVAVHDHLASAVAVGHRTRVFVILGFPDERRRDIWRSLAFVARVALLGIADINVFLFTPYPDSELFDELRTAGEIGALDDEYVDGLFVQADMTVRRSYCRRIAWTELFVYRVVGMVLFYTLAYVRRPGRLTRLVRGLLTSRFEPQNILERRIIDFVRVLRRRPMAN